MCGWLTMEAAELLQWRRYALPPKGEGFSPGMSTSCKRIGSTYSFVLPTATTQVELWKSNPARFGKRPSNTPC